MKKFCILISPFLIGIFALFFGSYHIGPLEILKILINFAPKTKSLSVQKAIIWEIRLPRVLLAGLTGAALSGSGAVLQAIFKNPLVDSYILGISAGAAFGCAITIAFFSFLPIQPMAFVFGILAVALTYFTAKSQSEVSRLALVLAGVIVTAFFSAMVSIIKFLVDPHRLQSIVYWLMGSFSLADWKTIKVTAPGIIIGLIPLILMSWRLNILSMGEEEAKLLGIDVEKERILFIAFSTIAVASATSACGIIGWIGLMVPHLIRMTFGPDHKALLPLSITGGASLMIIADTISRTLTSFDIPVGIITAIAGAPFFIYLMRKSGTGWN